MSYSLKEIWQNIVDYFIQDDPYDTPVVEPVAHPVKKRVHTKRMDKTRLTQYHYDLIMVAYGNYVKWNSTCGVGKRVTHQDVTNELNMLFGLDKSPRSYARVWEGLIPRDSMARGTTPDGEIYMGAEAGYNDAGS